MRVCLVLEGSYPYIYGGVSSWTHQLISSMPDVEFVLMVIAPKMEYKGKFVYELPKNVVEVKEYFLDAPLLEKPSRRYRFHFTDGEKEEIKKLFSCDNPNWDILIDAFRRQKCRSGQYLMSRDFMELFDSYILEHYMSAPYADLFYLTRSMFLPVLYLLGAEIPKADEYHAICTGYAGLLTVVANHVTGKPVLLTEHGIYSREREEELIRAQWIAGSLKPRWVKFYYMLSNAIYSRAEKVTALFKGASEIQQTIGADPSRCMIISNGIDYDRFSKAPEKKPDGFIDIGAAVRFAKIKGIKQMIYAFATVSDAVPNARLHIIGPDEDKEYAEECRTLIKNLGLKNIITPGRVSDMPGYYGKCDFTILTSLSEGQPLTILEAFAAGRPVVATNVGCCSELVYGINDDRFGQAGYIANSNDVKDIAQKMIRLCRHPEEVKKFGENGRKRAFAYYQRKDMVKHYRDLYEGVNH